MTQQKLELQLKGLYTSPNNLSGVPPGALEIADNVVINTKSLVESRRGQTQYNHTVGGGIKKLFNYRSTLILNYEDKMAYDNGSSWTDFAGSYLEPTSDIKIRSMEALKNFYFTTSQGVYKIGSISGAPVPSGVVKALSGTATLTGGSGFLANDTAVAYRLVWGYTDANQNLILGAPSPRLIIGNSTGGDRDVALTYSIPDTVTTSYFYQLYRSFGTVGATATPSDELQLVAQASPTSGDLTARSITIGDNTPYALMRTTLYTSPSQEGISNSNNTPPFATDMAIFKSCAFYSNIRLKQSLSLTLIGAGWPSISYTSQYSSVVEGFPVVTVADTSQIREGMRVTGPGTDTGYFVVSIDGPNQITMSAPATGTDDIYLEFQDKLSLGSVDIWGGSSTDPLLSQFQVVTSGTPGTNISDTAQQIVLLLNTMPANSLLYAFYLSGPDDLPGQMYFEERAIGGDAFYATSTAGSAFSPTLYTTGTGTGSDNGAKQNRVMISKAGQVEAVPAYRYFDVGSANFPIQRTVALRDGIFFFKADGIYRLSGETFESFTVTLLDNTVVLQVPESAVAFNNQVFCFTTQAVCAVTDSGVRIMSVPIESTLLQLSSAQYTNFVGASFGVAYESARQYMFFTVTSESDTYATQAFIYNSLTDSWTRWVMPRVCGIVNPALNKLFMGRPDGVGSADNGQVMVERKNYTNRDYADESYLLVITSVISDTELVVTSTSNLTVGMTILQNGRETVITSIASGTNTLTVTAITGLVPDNATVYTPILNKVRWAPIDADNPGLLKQFSEVSFFFRNAAFSVIKDIEFATNIIATGEKVPINNNSFPEAWGKFRWGEAPWGGQLGGQAVLRTYVPRDAQRGNWLTLSLEIEEAFTGFSLQGVSLIYNLMSSRLR